MNTSKKGLYTLVVGVVFCFLFFFLDNLLYSIFCGIVGVITAIIGYIIMSLDMQNAKNSQSPTQNNKNVSQQSNPTKSSTNTPVPVFEFQNIRVGQFVVLDFETTGLSPENDHIIQIGAIKYQNAETIDTFCTYVKPPVEIPNRITEITGIYNFTVANAPSIKNVLPGLIDFIGELDIICHNASFDIAFLNKALSLYNISSIQNKVYDTLQLSRKYISAKSHKLEDLKNLFNLEHTSHDALDDCKTTGYVYLYCLSHGAIPQPLQFKTCSKEPVPQNTVNTATQVELSFFKEVEEFYKSQNLPTVLLQHRNTGNYFDVCYDRFAILRLKVTGRVKYLLVRTTLDQFTSLYGDSFECCSGSKSEVGHIRVLLNTPGDLLRLNKLLVAEYHNTVKQYENNMRYKNGRTSSDITIDLKEDI